jgi:hypothetical protein
MADLGFLGDIGSFIASLVNIDATNRAYDTQDRELNRILDQYSGLSLPQLREAVAEQAGPNAFGSIQEDPKLRALQMRALEGFGREADQRGLTEMDRAALAESLSASGRHEAGLRGAIANRAAATGMGGANTALVQALSGGQAAANQAHAQALGVAGQSRERAMNALGQLGTMSTAVRGQDYGVARDRAAAQNQLNQFNAGMNWQAQQHNLGLDQQSWENMLQKMGLVAGAQTARGRSATDRARAQSGLIDRAGTSGGNALGGLARVAGGGLAGPAGGAL